MMTGKHVAVDGADDRHVAHRLGPRPGDLWESRAGWQRRRVAALVEPGLAEEGGQAAGQEVDGDAGDDLVAALGDGGEAVRQRQGDRGEDRRAQAGPGRRSEERRVGKAWGGTWR